MDGEGGGSARLGPSVVPRSWETAWHVLLSCLSCPESFWGTAGRPGSKTSGWPRARASSRCCGSAVFIFTGASSLGLGILFFSVLAQFPVEGDFK